MIKDNTIVSRWLTLLGVKHTASYTDKRFKSMPFPTLFGLSNLLKEYNIQSNGYEIDDKKEISQIPVPFIAPVKNKFVIVECVKNDRLYYSTVGVQESISTSDFIDVWSGVAFTAEVTSKSIEPDFVKHKMAEAMADLRDIGIWTIGLLLFAWFFITRGDLHNWGTIVLPAVYAFGLWLSMMLVGKDWGIKSKRSDAVCNVLQPGGCDSITKSDAATFLGIFHWSEVGFTYFSVGLIVLLLFPQYAGWLALIDVCALPYTVWSITYQKFKAKTWCTMCVGVQLTLWIQFFIFLLSGWYKHIMPFSWNAIVLLFVYGGVMLTLNRLDSFIKKLRATN